MGCGRAVAVSVAPEECPTCNGTVWEYRPADSDRSSGQTEVPSASLAALAEWVIGSDPVRRWRYEQLQRAGYPSGDAFVLSARSDVDLHRAIRLLRDQCPVATAMRILI